MFVAPTVPTHSVDIDNGIAKGFLDNYAKHYNDTVVGGNKYFNESDAGVNAYLANYNTTVKTQAPNDAVKQSFANKIYTRWISPYADWMGLTGGKGPDVTLEKPADPAPEPVKNHTSIVINIENAAAKIPKKKKKHAHRKMQVPKAFAAIPAQLPVQPVIDATQYNQWLQKVSKDLGLPSLKDTSDVKVGTFGYNTMYGLDGVAAPAFPLSAPYYGQPFLFQGQ